MAIDYQSLMRVTEKQPAVISDKKRRPRVFDTSSGAQPYVPEKVIFLAGDVKQIQFQSLVREIVVQNNSGQTIYYGYTGKLSTVSFAILTGATWVDTVRVDSIWLYCPTATTVNPDQSDGTGVVVIGKL